MVKTLNSVPRSHFLYSLIQHSSFLCRGLSLFNQGSQPIAQKMGSAAGHSCALLLQGPLLPMSSFPLLFNHVLKDNSSYLMNAPDAPDPTQEVFPSRRDEAHFRRGVSRLITPILWNFQRVIHTLAATQEVPRHTRLHLRGSTRVPLTSRGAPFPPPSSRGGILSLPGRERFPGVPDASQEVALSRGKARGTPWSCRQSQSPPDVSVHYRENLLSLHCLDFQAEDRLTPRWLVGQPCGKASWQASRESHRSLDPREEKRDTAATAREEIARECPNSR